jgi:hypothetical protein
MATAATTEFQVTLSSKNVETNARHAAAKMGGGATAEQLLLYGKEIAECGGQLHVTGRPGMARSAGA